MRTVDDILALWPSMASLAEDIGEDSATVRMWKRRQSIPAEYDVRIIKAAKERKILLDFEALAKSRAIEAHRTRLRQGVG